MSLKNALKEFRGNPVIKQALGRGEKPDVRSIYDALRQVMANPYLAHYTEITEPFHYKNIMTRPFHGEEYKKYLTNGTKMTNWYQEAAESLNLNLSRAVRGKISSSVRKEIQMWCNSNIHRSPLSDDALKELFFIEGIKPDGPTTLYRGIMFSKGKMKDPTRYPRSPTVFLDALAHGHTEILINDWMSSWTYSPDIANRFAKKNPAASEYAAMTNWLRNANRFIDGELGLVLEATFDPEDIVCEIDKIDIGHLQHGSENEVIVNAGNHRVKVIHIYTPTGEINVQQYSEWISNRDSPSE